VTRAGASVGAVIEGQPEDSVPFDAGYSKRPLWMKLGLKPGAAAQLVSPPEGLAEYLAEAGAQVQVHPTWDDVPHGSSFVHVFTDERAVVWRSVPGLADRIARDGMIWVSWPKKASKVPTDVTEDVIRARALEGDLVDVKVCAVDATWSALKLVIRKERRAQRG